MQPELQHVGLLVVMIVFLLKTEKGCLLFVLSNKGMEEISCQSDS